MCITLYLNLKEGGISSQTALHVENLPNQQAKLQKITCCCFLKIKEQLSCDDVAVHHLYGTA